LIRGAREHNLKNISVDVPLDKLVVFTGVSGSGKSSIAKDIIYAEGQRRYLDCLSPYARQYIKELKRPEIDSLTNIAPTICVYQHTFQPSRLSTVATMSEIYNFLRLLYAKNGIQYCPEHPAERIAALAPLEMSALMKRIPAKTIRLFAPVIKGKKGSHKAVLQRAIDSEISHVRIDGVLFKTSALTIGSGLEKNKPHTIEYLVAQFNPSQVTADFISAGVEQALSLASGAVVVSADGKDSVYSSERACPICQRGFFKPDPEDLSFNSPRGRCPRCEGTGKGRGDTACPECHGARIHSLGRSLKLGERSIAAAAELTPPQLRSFLDTLDFTPRQREIAEPIMRELSAKIETLEALGLGDIALNRECTTLSGGELQRLRLGTAMGSPLSGVVYIFDEPSVGLHPLDNRKVLERLRTLCERGNSVLMIEHDADSILAADYVIDVGPGGGRNGGAVVFAGPQERFLACESSITAAALRAESPSSDPTPSENPMEELTIEHGSKHNIGDISITLPLQRFITVAGVSGAGKSSFVHGVIGETLLEGDGEDRCWERGSTRITSSIDIARILLVDQKPIGVNSRSTPASYLGIWDEIRKVFAGTIEAKARGWGGGFFSYNTGKGRCPECKGQGQLKIEMNFLADAWVECETCRGRRFSEEAETVRFADLTISDVLNLTFEEARTKFTHHRKIIEPIRQAVELGLGYLTLGQSSPSLSGGESQRLKLVAELSAERRGHTVYLLDEPTTGLHKADVDKLVRTLRALVNRGHTVIVIEHDSDIIRAADHVIEFGPGAGAAGGKVIFSGPPGRLLRAPTPWGSLLGGAAAPVGRQAVKKAPPQIGVPKRGRRRAAAN
jgi:excinuclease ABC subunit A